MADSTEVRPFRLCDSCGGVDDHPRHVVAHPPGGGPTDPDILVKAVENAPKEALRDVLAQAQDDTIITKHMDCCRADGCPDGSCNVVTKDVEHLKGYDLVEHLVGLDPLQPDQQIVNGEIVKVTFTDEKKD
jgi:hypothetical protein